jgi:hypothetical protein
MVLNVGSCGLCFSVCLSLLGNASVNLGIVVVLGVVFWKKSLRDLESRSFVFNVAPC